MSNGGCSASLDRLSQDQLRSARVATTLDHITGTAVLEFGPAETLSPVGAGSPAYPSLCRPRRLPRPAHPREKPRVLDLGALLPVRDGLSAGGKWIRTISTARGARRFCLARATFLSPGNQAEAT